MDPEHGVDPLDLTRLAKLLINIKDPSYIKINRDLLLAASKLKDPSGTLLLSKISLKEGRAMPSACLQHFKEMISENNYAALFVQGQIYEAGKQYSLALEMYMKSLNSTSEGQRGAEAFDITLGEVWISVYRLLFRKDKEGAHTAIKKAALEYDEPSAYYLLAKEFTPQTSSDYEKYMLKAAASGEIRAVAALGKYYLQQSQRKQSLAFNKSLHNPVMSSSQENEDSAEAQEASSRGSTEAREASALAREWLNISAEANIPSI